MTQISTSSIKHDLTRTLYGSFGGPRTDRERLRRVSPQKLWDKVLDRRARDTLGNRRIPVNPIIERTLVALRSSGFEDPFEITPRVAAHVEGIFARYNPTTQLEKAIILFRSIIPHNESFKIAGVRHKGLSIRKGGLEVHYCDDLLAPQRIAHESQLPEHILEDSDGRRIAWCLEFSHLLIVLLRSAGIMAEAKTEIEHSYLIARLDNRQYILDVANLSFRKGKKRANNDRISISAHYSNKGGGLASQGRSDEEIESYDESLRFNPHLSQALSNKGAALEAKRKFDDAMKCYDEALGIDPYPVAALLNKGDLLGIQGRYDESLEYYEKAIRREPNNAEAIFNKGVALVALGKLDAAIKCYDECLGIDPIDINALGSKGWALLKQLKIFDSLKYFFQAIYYWMIE